MENLKRKAKSYYILISLINYIKGLVNKNKYRNQSDFVERAIIEKKNREIK